MTQKIIAKKKTSPRVWVRIAHSSIENGDKKKIQFKLGVTNARSLNRRAASVVETMDELDLSVLAMTETWLEAGRTTSKTPN